MKMLKLVSSRDYHGYPDGCLGRYVDAAVLGVAINKTHAPNI